MNSEMKLIIFICVIVTVVAIQVPNSWKKLNIKPTTNEHSDAEDVIDTSYEYISPDDDRHSSGKLKTQVEDDTYKPERLIAQGGNNKRKSNLKILNRYKKTRVQQPIGYKTVIYRTPNNANIQTGPKIIINQPYLQPKPPEPRPRSKPYRNNVPYISHRQPASKKRVYRKESGTIYPNLVYNPFSSKENQNNNVFPITDFNTLPFITTDKPDKIDPILFPQYGVHKQQYTPEKVEAIPENVLKSFQHQNPFFDNLNFNPFINSPYILHNEYQHTNKLKPKNHQPVYTAVQTFQNHLTKNYRDDKTHEPSVHDQKRHSEEVPEIERSEDEKAPISVNEKPQEVPTKPIYPGEGKWAQPGIKYMPYMSNHKYAELEKTHGTPDGYQTFVEGQNLFLRNKNKLSQKFNEIPERHDLGNALPQQDVEPIEEELQSEDEQEETSEEDEEEEEFIPTKLYAQVRHSDHEEHLPSEAAEDGRLREVIKDSKIQTVYTEEGYEDSGYDHAGHEKNAEDEEAFAENEGDVVGVSEKKVPLRIPKIQLDSTKYDNGGIISYENDKDALVEDSDTSGSHYIYPTYINKINDSKNNNPDLKNTKQNFISTKEIKTMKTKEKEDGNVEMEISGSIKVVVQPNNSTKTHKYIKVFPKIHKTVANKYNSDDNNDRVENATVKEVPGNRKSFNGDGIFLEEIISTPDSSDISHIETSTPASVTTSTTELFQEIFTMEIPTTTQPTTAIPKFDYLEQETTTHRSNSESRVKRFTNDFPKFDIDTQFISKISHQLEKPKPPYSLTKYPYYENYHKMGLSENSPLRYSESMKNIPLKRGKDLAFYEQAESRMKCPEVETTVDPIPERVKYAENHPNYDEYNEDLEEIVEDDTEKAASSDEHDIVQAPRLQGLGDKIDCMKKKYFGENPLDSPFFREELVGPVKPIFGLNDDNGDIKKPISLNTGSVIIKNENKLHESTQGVEELPPFIILLNKEELLSPSDHQHVNEIENSRKDLKKPNISKSPTAKSENNIQTSSTTTKEYEEKNVTDNFGENNAFGIGDQSERKLPNDPTLSPINLLTTPKYTINLKPEHIYHQIELLRFLPEDGNNSNRTEEKSKDNSAKSLEIDKINNDVKLAHESGEPNNTSREAKSIKLPPNNINNHSNQEVIPEAEALKRRKRIRLKQPLRATSYITPLMRDKDVIPGRMSPFQIFDVNKFLPSTQEPVFKDLVAQGSNLPKYKVVSEVFYKDEIKPNEQLNVLNDVINIIRNSSQEQLEDSSHNNSVSHTLKLNPFKLKLYQNDNVEHNTNKNYKYQQDSYLKAYGEQEIDDKYYTTITTSKPTDSTKQNQHKYMPIKYIKTSPVPKYRIRRPNYKTTSAATTYDVTESFLQENNNFSEGTTQVKGLVRPGSQRATPNAKRDSSQNFSNYGTPEIIHLNKYWVMGMRPPPKQRTYAYSDFFNNNFVNRKRYAHYRNKRNANRGLYSQLSRNKNIKPEFTEEAKVTNETDDDYVPHRPRNFHYDENTGKIVYHTVKPDNDDEELEEVVYEDIIEETFQTEKPKQNSIFATATPPPQGKSYIDFVKKLKSAADYQLITDPTTTERQAITKQLIDTTQKPVSTTPPEFLGILAKIRKNSEYKFIEDKKEVQTTTPSSEEVITEVDEEEEDDDEDQETRIRQNIKNSPGGDAYEIGRHFEIFDISDFIPKLRNYLPRTSVDTSKYKIIQRPSRQNVTNTTTNAQETSSPSTRAKMEYTAKTEDTINGDSHFQEEVFERHSTTSSTTTALPSTLTPQVKRSRGRKQTSHLRQRGTSPTTTEIPQTEVVHHDKARRNFRRRPTRIQRPTTEKFFEDVVDDTTKILRRRSGFLDDEKESIELDGRVEYRNEDLIETPKENLDKQTNGDSLPPKSAVEVFQEFDSNRKHGGNYRSVEEPIPNSQSQQLNNDNVEIVGEYNRNHQHGGNYRNEESDTGNDSSNIKSKSEAQVETVINEQSEGPMIINLLLGQLEIEPSVDKKRTITVNELQRKIKRKKKPQKKFGSNTNIQRLTDIVPKPESYYSDPNLPLAVNMLLDTIHTSNTSINTLENHSSTFKNKEPVNIQNRTVKRKITRPKIETHENDEKLPKIIKDPSKRLYFYAPL